MISMTMATVIGVLVLLAWLAAMVWAFQAAGMAAGVWGLGQGTKRTCRTQGPAGPQTARRYLVFANETATDTSRPQDPAASPSRAQHFEAAVLSNLESAGGDGWYPVAPFGDHPHPWGLQCLSADDAAGLVAWANGQGEAWTGVPVYANPAHPKDGPALAWVKGFRVLANELQCQPEWSPEGHLQIVVNKAFKRVTPSWTCERRNDGKWHPVNIVHIGLTNVPNIQATRPWVNTEGQEGNASGGRGAAGSPDPTGIVAPADGLGDSPVAATPAAGAAQQEVGAILANGGPWWDEFVAKLQAVVRDAPTGEVAATIVQEKLNELWKARDALEATLTLIRRIAGSVAVQTPPPPIAVVPMDDAAKANFALIGNAVDRLADRALRLERELGDARAALAAEREFANSAVVDLYIARGRVDPAKRVAALAICAAGRDVALAAWDNAAVAVPRRSAVRSTPADPLAGAVLSNTAPATGRVAPPAGQDLERIIAAGKRLQNERGLDPSAANREAWAMYHSGTLETFTNSKETTK
jgi:hypothetical protein